MKVIAALLIASASAAKLNEPLIHPETGLAITTTGYHWYGQEPLALAQTKEKVKTEEPLIHPETGLAITTTGYHWYGQEPLALAQRKTPEPWIHPVTGEALMNDIQHKPWVDPITGQQHFTHGDIEYSRAPLAEPTSHWLDDKQKTWKTPPSYTW